ncbi:hypothetical protein DFH28DRAFT_956394 [Melampsora americana]|nr:hypothetical protein DFH28DRAFT_956394 [Melampsora americana]
MQRTKSMNKLTVFFFIQVLVHIWDIGPRTLAHLGLSTPLRPQFEPSFAEGPSSLLLKKQETPALNHDHLHVYNPINLKKSLKTYLKKPPNERRKMYPFFDMSRPRTTYTRMINQMLHSEKESWGETLQDLLESESASKNTALWNFLLELIEHMPTPAVQVTLMAALREQEKTLVKEALVNEDMQKLLDEVKRACVDEIRYHVISLKGKSKSDRFKNIFTKQEQEKFGIYKIKLEKEWLPSQENNLFKYWASHMDVYLKVKGSLKGMIESQVILIHLVRAGHKNTKKIELLPEFERWIISKIDTLTNGLTQFINSLDDEGIERFASIQSELGDGFDIIGVRSSEQKRRLLAFWVKNIPFYFGFKDIESKQSWLPVLENLILQDTQHMKTVIQDFLKTSTPSDSQETFLFEFLKFHVEKTHAQSSRKISEIGLTYGKTI